jgi:hypothetical protein
MTRLKHSVVFLLDLIGLIVHCPGRISESTSRDTAHGGRCAINFSHPQSFRLRNHQHFFTSGWGVSSIDIGHRRAERARARLGAPFHLPTTPWLSLHPYPPLLRAQAPSGHHPSPSIPIPHSSSRKRRRAHPSCAPRPSLTLCDGAGSARRPR